MAKSRIELVGDRRLQKDLRELRAESKPLTGDALDEWGNDVQEAAQRGVPVQTGHLQSNIEKRINRTTLTARVGVWDVLYARWTEFGNSRQEAQPYLYPAFTRHQKIRSYVRKQLKKRL